MFGYTGGHQLLEYGFVLEKGILMLIPFNMRWQTAFRSWRHIYQLIITFGDDDGRQ